MRSLSLIIGINFLICGTALGQTDVSSSLYNIYSGNTHSHTSYTWSHGNHLERIPDQGKYMNIDSTHSSRYINMTLKDDWQLYQGPPSEHFAIAKANDYDFYITTDHSQEAAFRPTGGDNGAWSKVKDEAYKATDSTFVALTGYEHSENNGPGAQGHINVINTSEYLNALEPNVDLPTLYEWLKKIPSNKEGPVVATFNHPRPGQYDNFAHRDSEVTEIITMLEVINSNKQIYLQGFIEALDKGWKVSPVAGNDNHNIAGITNHTSRTFVLAPEKTKTSLLDAMKNRRTYASLEKNIRCIYFVNGHIMGSSISPEKSFKFDIKIEDPDTNNPLDKITKIEILKDGGEVVKVYEPEPSFSVKWTPTIQDPEASYFFVRVWNAGGGDHSDVDPKEAVAWLAPVWVETKK